MDKTKACWLIIRASNNDIWQRDPDFFAVEFTAELLTRWYGLADQVGVLATQEAALKFAAFEDGSGGSFYEFATDANREQWAPYARLFDEAEWFLLDNLPAGARRQENLQTPTLKIGVNHGLWWTTYEESENAGQYYTMEVSLDDLKLQMEHKEVTNGES